MAYEFSVFVTVTDGQKGYITVTEVRVDELII